MNIRSLQPSPTAVGLGIPASSGSACVAAPAPTPSQDPSSPRDDFEATATGADAEKVGALATDTTLRPAAAPPFQSVWKVSKAPGDKGVSVAIQVNGADGQPITQFTPLHGMPMHLIAIGPGLTLAAHVHPKQTARGFTAEVPLPKPAHYVLFDEYQPAPASDAVLDRTETDTASSPGKLGTTQWDFSSQTKSVNGLTFKLVKGGLMPGMEMPVSIQVLDSMGKPAPLQPWIGAQGHLFATQEGAPRLYHFHPSDMGPMGTHAAGMPPMPMPGDGTLAFNASVAEGGPFRLFLQVLKQGDAVPTTVSFDVKVPAATPSRV